MFLLKHIVEGKKIRLEWSAMATSQEALCVRLRSLVPLLQRMGATENIQPYREAIAFAFCIDSPWLQCAVGLEYDPIGCCTAGELKPFEKHGIFLGAVITL